MTKCIIWKSSKGAPHRKPCWQCCLRICRPERWTHKRISCNCCCACPKVTMIIENLHGLTRVARSLLLAWHELQRRREAWGTDIESDALLLTLLTDKGGGRAWEVAGGQIRRQSKRQKTQQKGKQSVESATRNCRQILIFAHQMQLMAAGTHPQRGRRGAPLLSNCFILLIMHWAAYKINPQSVAVAPQWVLASILPGASSVSPSVSCFVAFWLNFNFKCPETQVTC